MIVIEFSKNFLVQDIVINITVTSLCVELKGNKARNKGNGINK